MVTKTYSLWYDRDTYFINRDDGATISPIPRTRLRMLENHGFVREDFDEMYRQLDETGYAVIEVPLPVRFRQL